jgi:hypothetical protein
LSLDQEDVVPNSLEIPNTPAGNELRQLVEAINTDDVQAILAIVGQEARAKELMQTVYHNTHGLEVVAIEENIPFSIAILARALAAPEWLRITVKVDQEAPHNIVEESFQFVPTPPEFMTTEERVLRETDLPALPPIETILSIFDHYPLVAIGDVHWHEETLDFISRLVRDPAFCDKAHDIVVEFGNARYQAVMDRYIAGEEVAMEDLQGAWRDTLYFLTWHPAMYRNFFTIVREINQGLPSDKKLRVILAEESFDWQALPDKAAWEQISDRREKAFADRIFTEVLAKGRKALLIFGTLHTLRRGVAPPEVPVTPALIAPMGQFLDEQHPDSIFTIWPYNSPAITFTDAPYITAWPIPSLGLVKGNWLGALPLRKVFGPRIPQPDWRTWPQMHIEDALDGILYLGETLTETGIDFEALGDEVWVEEMQRRAKLLGEPFISRLQSLLTRYNKRLSDG